MGDLAARFVNVSPGELDQAIVDCQRHIVTELDLDRSALFQVVDGRDLRFTHSWTRPELEVSLPPLTAAAAFPWFLSKLHAGETVAVSNLDAVPSAVDREGLKRIQTKSTVVVPIVVGEQLAGAVTFASMRTERSWPAPVVDRLRLVAWVFAQALAHRRDQQHLQLALAENQRLREQLSHDNEVLDREVRGLRAVGPLTAESEAMQLVLRQIDQVASTDATVLLIGETGSGKEVVAQVIHDRSQRHKRPMLCVNCAAIPVALLESELFGRERGAYTGATSRQVGRFEMATGSTILLDEVGELPPEAQAKLLRVVEHQVVERLGGGRPIKVDVRVIAATNRDLENAVVARTFREDLYYRLNVFPIRVPPLRERVEDIPSIVWTFVDHYSGRLGKRVETVSRDSLEALRRYSWPGNVRELRNVVERAMIVANGPHLSIDLPVQTASSVRKSVKIADVEAAHIRAVLDQTAWRVRGAGGAADLLGMKPTTLEGRMARLGIRRPERHR